MSDGHPIPIESADEMQIESTDESCGTPDNVHGGPVEGGQTPTGTLSSSEVFGALSGIGNMVGALHESMTEIAREIKSSFRMIALD